MEHYLDLVPASKYAEEPIPPLSLQKKKKKFPETQLSLVDLQLQLCFAFLAPGDYEPGLRGDGWLWMPSKQLLSASLDHKNLAFGVHYSNNDFFSPLPFYNYCQEREWTLNLIIICYLLLHLVKYLTCWSEVSAENHRKAEELKLKGPKTKKISVEDCIGKWVEVWFWNPCHGPPSLPLKNIEGNSM